MNIIRLARSLLRYPSVEPFLNELLERLIILVWLNHAIPPPLPLGHPLGNSVCNKRQRDRLPNSPQTSQSQPPPSGDPLTQNANNPNGPEQRLFTKSLRRLTVMLAAQRSYAQPTLQNWLSPATESHLSLPKTTPSAGPGSGPRRGILFHSVLLSNTPTRLMATGCHE